jgi:alkylhydroperoxidase family enzyme
VNPLVDPVDPTRVPPDLGAAIEAGVRSRMLSTPVAARRWAHRPAVALAELALYRSLFDDTALDGRLLELVRLRVAMLNDCGQCRVARKSDDVTEADIACLATDDARFSERESLALRYAELLVVDHHAVDEDLRAALRLAFGPDELVELSLFVAMVLGLGRVNHVLSGDPLERGPTESSVDS